MKADDVRKVGVVGCGVMGAGIVEVCARAGLDVRYVEANPDLVERGRSRIEASILRAVERGKLEEQRGAEDLTRIAGSTTIDDLADRDLVIEAATEHQETKREVFRRLDEVTRPEVVLASNTSSIPIVELAAVTGRPAQVVGMHFFNPVPVMGLIEVVRAITTSDETVGFSRGFGAVLGKTTVLSKDRAGFIVNMLLIPYLNGAVRMLDEGFRHARGHRHGGEPGPGPSHGTTPAPGPHRAGHGAVRCHRAVRGVQGAASTTTRPKDAGSLVCGGGHFFSSTRSYT